MNRFTNVINFLKTILSFISKDLALELEQAIVFLETEGKQTVVAALAKLKRIATVTVAAFSAETSKFFVSGKNGITKIWMSEEFQNRVKKFLPKQISCTDGQLASFDLSENMYDSQILPELGNPPHRKMSEVVAQAASLVSKQPNGENGSLLTNGYANIFYGLSDDDGRVLVLGVRWYDGKWRWYCRGLGEIGVWLAGVRVFSSATVEPK